MLESDKAILGAVTLPRFKLRWLRTQEKKDKAKEILLAECRSIVRNEDRQEGTITTPICTSSSKEDQFFSFEDEDDNSATAESQVAEYLKSGAQGMDSLNGFPLIREFL